MFIFICKQKTAYEVRISDWSSDVCSSDLHVPVARVDMLFVRPRVAHGAGREARPAMGARVAPRLPFLPSPPENGAQPGDECEFQQPLHFGFSCVSCRWTHSARLPLTVSGVSGMSPSSSVPPGGSTEGA